MKILVTAPFLDRTGAPMALLRLVQGLAGRHEVHAVVRPGADMTLRPAFEAAGVGFRLGVPIPGDFDVALAVTLVQSRAVRTIGPRLPTVWWIQEPVVGLDLIRQRPAVIEGFAAASRIVFVARWQAETIYRPWLGATPWTVVPVGHDIDPTPQPPPFARQPGHSYFLQLGSLVRRKAADVTLAALALLDDPRVHVLFLGDPVDPAYGEELRRTVAASPRLSVQARFEPSVDVRTMLAYLQHADGLVMPTRDDNVPTVVTEAMQSGCAVIATALPPIVETINNGSTGLLVPVDDPGALAAAMARLRDDPALGRRLGDAARAEGARRFGLAPFVAGMEAALVQAAADRA